MEFTVLMSVYKSERATYLREALKSVLDDQILLPNELVLIEDGPLNNELEEVIKYFENKYRTIIKVIKLKDNHGLGEALNIGLKHCSNEIVVRMDSDDVSRSDRFIKQINYMKENPEIDLIGSSIKEFESTIYEVLSVKKVPCTKEEIISFAKKRNPFNHMTVCFKKSAVINAGGYKHLPFLEDYYLWIRMILNGCEVRNNEEPLVYMRTGNQMLVRRSNKAQIKSWIFLQKYMTARKFISQKDHAINVISIVIFVYMPIWMKKALYKRILRNRDT